MSIYIPSYKQLALQYEYDPEQPFDEQIAAEKKLEGGTVREVTIRGADGEPIPVVLTIPEGPPGHFLCSSMTSHRMTTG